MYSNQKSPALILFLLVDPHDLYNYLHLTFWVWPIAVYTLHDSPLTADLQMAIKINLSDLDLTLFICARGQFPLTAL